MAKESTVVKKKFDELGRVKGGGNRGGSGAWSTTVRRLAHKIEPRSTGVDRIKGKPPSCIFEVTYVCQFSKSAGPMVKTKQKN